MLKHLCTKENITFLIAIIGFIVSIINLSYFFIIRKINLTVCFGNYGIKNYYQNKKILLIHYRFDNSSQLAIAITKIQILIDNNAYECDIRKNIAEKYERKRGSQLVCENITYTDILPINIPPLASCSGYLGFVIPPDIMSTHEKALTFRICTNRGRAIQKTFALHEDTICR